MGLAESFVRTSFARFLNSTAGRIVRVIAGIILIGWGLFGGETILVLVGLIPLIAGAFDLCLISALLGGPIRPDRSGKSAS